MLSGYMLGLREQTPQQNRCKMYESLAISRQVIRMTHAFGQSPPLILARSAERNLVGAPGRHDTFQFSDCGELGFMKLIRRERIVKSSVIGCSRGIAAEARRPQSRRPSTNHRGEFVATNSSPQLRRKHPCCA